MEHVIIDTGGILHFAPLCYADFFIELIHGGVVQRCYSKRFHEWSLSLIYYKVKNLPLRKSQVLNRKPPFYRSGFVSRVRGLHWNYRRRN